MSEKDKESLVKAIEKHRKSPTQKNLNEILRLSKTGSNVLEMPVIKNNSKKRAELKKLAKNANPKISPSEAILTDATAVGLSKCIVVGSTMDGRLYYKSSIPDGSWMQWMFTKTIHDILKAQDKRAEEIFNKKK